MATNQTEDEPITVRLDPKTVARIEEHAKTMQERAPAGVKLSRLDAIRNLIARGLADAGRAR